MFKKLWQIILLPLLGGLMATVWGQAVTVVEYYNQPLDAYFITGRVTEQQSLDAAAGFQRTGMTFQAVTAASAVANPAAGTRICRFYVNTTTPYSNSHFYGREGTDCESLRAQNFPGFNWEDYDFALRQPSGGACPSGTTTIYRSFRPAAGGKSANHRYSASAQSYAASAAAGYVAEQPAFCATAATDLMVLTVADCGPLYYSGVRIGYQSLNSQGAADTWWSYKGAAPVTFNGKAAQPFIEQHLSGLATSLMLEETVDTWTDLGARTQSGVGMVDRLYLPSATYLRRMIVGQVFVINRYVAFSPSQSSGSPTQTGEFTFLGRELLTAQTGTYLTCKFSARIESQFAAIGRTELKRTTWWVVPGVGIVKSIIEASVPDDFGPSVGLIRTEVNAVSVQRL